MSEQRDAQQVNHQTIRLSKGKHAAPTEGACVMELASMLAGEPFSDRPATACPVVGGFLRAYNDRIDDERRQDLYRYASEVVGSRGSAEIERRRERRCLEWAEERKRERARPLRWVLRASPSVVDRRLGLDAAGTYAARSIRRHTDKSHAAALALIDELLSMGRDAGARRAPLSPRAVGEVGPARPATPAA
ncbi:MAG TPA: hypothetical protein VGM91_22325 [Conexibacter sp.]|jgi:hypothetical protein